jgi:hypothetical protein
MPRCVLLSHIQAHTSISRFTGKASPPFPAAPALAGGELAHSANEHRVVWCARAVPKHSCHLRHLHIRVQPQPVMWAAEASCAKL